MFWTCRSTLETFAKTSLPGWQVVVWCGALFCEEHSEVVGRCKEGSSRFWKQRERKGVSLLLSVVLVKREKHYLPWFSTKSAVLKKLVLMKKERENWSLCRFVRRESGRLFINCASSDVCEILWKSVFRRNTVRESKLQRMRCLACWVMTLSGFGTVWFAGPRCYGKQNKS